MNKRLLKFALISMVCASVPVTYTSCSDNDDDIDRLDSTTDTMQSQIAALETALEQAKTAAANAQASADAAAQAAKDAAAKGDTALAEAQQAKADAAAALKAAQDAKAEAIEAALAAINELKGSIATQETVDALSTKISAIEDSLDKLGGTVSAQANAIAQMEIQINALNKYSELLASLSGDNGKIAQIEAAIAEIKESMGNMATQASVEEVKAELTRLSEVVGKIEGNLITFITGRLTSVTLVPSLYVDGIETIEFRSLSYVPKTQVATGAGLANIPGATAVTVSTKENPAQYRLNPTSTGLKDIDEANIEFVAMQATSRGVVESPIKYVKGSAVIGATGLEKGIMTVNAEKATTGSLNLSNKQIYTVALRVPIAPAHLQDASTPEYVYSEYSRLIETVNTPVISQRPYLDKSGKHDCETRHYSDSTTIWNSLVSQDQLVTDEFVYNQPVDLTELVTGCLSNVPEEITKDELAKYGLEFQFAIAGIKSNVAYNNGAEHGTNQQEFIKFQDGSSTIVVSKTPNGATNNKAAIGKEPIIRVTLVDVNNSKIVDQRYLKIKWVAKDAPTVDLGDKEFEGTLGCNDIVEVINWRDFVNDIYTKLNMSKEQFTATYFHDAIPNLNIAASPKVEGLLSYGDRTPNVVFDGNVEGDAAIIRWTLTPGEIGTIIKYNTTTTPHTWSVDTNKNKYGIKITFTPNNPDSEDDPIVTYTLYTTINVDKVPSINGYYGNYWHNPYSLYDVYPVQYNSNAWKALVATDSKYNVCQFHNNLMNGFTFAQYASRGRFIIKDLAECGTWDMQFCKDNQLTYDGGKYTPNYASYTYDGIRYEEPDRDKAQNIGGYDLVWTRSTSLPTTSYTLAAQLEWPSGHSAWCGNGDHSEAYVNLEKNEYGKALLKAASTSESSSHIGVWATVNEWNLLPVSDYGIKFVKPLTLNEAQLSESFYDGVASGSRIDWTRAFSLRDCFGYLVAKVTTDNVTEKNKYAAELYNYYEVEEPQWDLENIRFGMKVQNGNIVVDDELTADNALTRQALETLTTGGAVPSLEIEGTELVFYSNMGSQVAGSFNLFVKVTVVYGWGTEEAWIKVRVNPLDASANRR